MRAATHPYRTASLAYALPDSNSHSAARISPAVIGWFAMMVCAATSTAGDDEPTANWRAADSTQIEREMESRRVTVLFFLPDSSPLSVAALQKHSAKDSIKWPASMKNRWQIRYTFGESNETLAAIKKIRPDVVFPKEPTIAVVRNRQDIKYFFAFDDLSLGDYLFASDR